jgi:hypothetical protein
MQITMDVIVTKKHFEAHIENLGSQTTLLNNMRVIGRITTTLMIE